MNRKKLLTILFSCMAVLSGNARAEDVSVPRLTPPGYQERMELNGRWSFSDSIGNVGDWSRRPEARHSIEVPGEWVMQGFQVTPGNTAGYVRTFTVPATWLGKRVKLRCNGVYSDSEVYINRRYAGRHLGGFTPFELDVTSLVTPGTDHQIALAVRSESMADSTANASKYAVHPLGGITRDIFLFALPEVNLSLVHASTTFDASYTDAVLETEVCVTNESGTAAQDWTVQLRLADAEGQPVRLEQATEAVSDLSAGQTASLRIRSKVSRPQQWNPEHPYLYTLTCQLLYQGKVMQTAVRRIGFRQIEVRKNQVFVNNHPIKLRGVCRHETMPLRGRSLSDGIWRKDVELFRRGNVNYIRTSHYPPDEALLDACDELGMFVEVEAPFCWAHQTDVPEEKHAAVLVNQHVEMVNRDRTHPSVLMWSLGNESNRFEEYFKEAGEVVRRLDPTRPRIFSQWGPDADGGCLEITNHHYPGPKGPDQYRSHRRPVVFDEYCHLNAYNRLELSADPGLRAKWGDLLDEMWSKMYHSKGVLGGAIWVGIDDTFFLPDGRTVGYGTWGTIDGWRREKPEYWGMKKAYSPVKIRLKGNKDAEGKVCFEIENRHLFSPLSDCRIEWEAAGQTGVLAVDLAPSAVGEASVQLPAEARDARCIDLRVTGTRGYEIDRYHFQIVPDIVRSVSEKRQKLPRIQCSETEGQLRITTANTVFVLDKFRGEISACHPDGSTLATGSTLMVLPLNSEGEGIQMVGKSQNFAPYTPTCANWTVRSVTWTADKEQVVVRVEGAYEEAEGRFDYRIGADGELTVGYRFVLKKEVAPRQIGLVFQAPDSFRRMSWKREGYWNVYPDHHIGALEGTAEAFDDRLPISGIAGPSQQPDNEWAFDQTKNGSNLFRSTKENIRQAQLEDGQCHRISVRSDGHQHFRTWIDNGRTWFLVADYSNAGSDTYFSSHAALGYRPLKRGDTVSGTAVLRFTSE